MSFPGAPTGIWGPGTIILSESQSRVCPAPNCTRRQTPSRNRVLGDLTRQPLNELKIQEASGNPRYPESAGTPKAIQMWGRSICWVLIQSPHLLQDRDSLSLFSLILVHPFPPGVGSVHWVTKVELMGSRGRGRAGYGCPCLCPTPPHPFT